MKINLALLLLCVSIRVVLGQELSGVIYPGSSYFNSGTDTVYYLTAEKIRTLLIKQDSLERVKNQLENYRKLNHYHEQQILLYRDANRLKQQEADYWRHELFSTDSLLEAKEIENTNLEFYLRKIKKNRKWYAMGGSLLGGIVVIIIGAF